MEQIKTHETKREKDDGEREEDREKESSAAMRLPEATV